MRPFILLDLKSQASFIPSDVRSWPRERTLAWLRQYGEVREWPVRAGDETQMWALFRAPSGLTTSFLLTEDGALSVFYGEYTIRAVWG